ncbi:MAG: hypothetical protein KAV45_01265 [Calditrichia bacterium]|nr:hypothetical protein [Calditrichia bacterium]
MSIFLGIDVGTVSIKIALLCDNTSQNVLPAISKSNDIFYQTTQNNKIKNINSLNLFVTKCFPLNGNPVQETSRLIWKILDIIPVDQIGGVRVCGSGGRLIGDLLGINNENEFRAIASGVGTMYPEILTVFEMGGQNSKYLSLEKDMETGTTGISDYEMSGDCAAGTGSFLDQQASRLKYDVDQIGDIVSGADKSAKIAGRCSVFAKTDMIHAQQKGFKPEEVMKGLCEAVARNFKSSIIKSKKIKTPVLFIGGVAKNTGVVNAVKKVFNFQNDELLVPEYYAWMPALGTALAEINTTDHSGLPDFKLLSDYTKKQSKSYSNSSPLSMKNVVLLRDRAKPEKLKKSEKKIDAYMGVDIGSVSTNVALIDNNGKMLKEIYTKTDGRPIEVVSNCLREVESELSDKICIRGVGTTGSGRELIGELIGSDTINDEITAHKTGAEFLAKTMLDTEPDTIFEIGGQDSKFISIENGVVVDFAMNEACAAGTGSFLEERAEELNISIKNEFARIALSSDSPVKLGERCTVFMQQDVASQQQKGVNKADITAGLAYSIVYNYLNRVVGRRKIGNVIFFQGGTAYNDAIASAFAMVLDREIIVPPYNGVIGAVGAALLAREKMVSKNSESKFRGFSLEKVKFTLKEFTCKACSNFCHMQEFTVENEKTYWGDQCSDKFRRRQSGEKMPIIDDLLRFRRELLFNKYDPDFQGKATIGLPRGMYIYEHFPFWNLFFRTLGYKVVLSDETNAMIIRQGNEASVAEPCLPVQVYHGHVQQLYQKGVDWIFIPNMINAETKYMDVNSYYCPWGQTLPFVIKNSSTLLDVKDTIINPPLRFRNGKKSVGKSLFEALKFLGETKKSITEALEAAYFELKTMQEALITSGKEALYKLQQSGEIGIILVGRTYNIYDRGMTLDIGNKLRDYYGVNVIPMDFLPLDTIDISDIHQNMYWNYGRKIIAAAKFIAEYANLHLIYLTNFKCGPDSYVKHYITKASGKPFLSLQFDGHSNDAGYITRCEAYLDSKGALRNWTKTETIPVI